MEVLFLKHWERHSLDSGKEMDAQLIFQDGVLSKIFIGRLTKNTEGLLEIPPAGTTLDQYLVQVRTYNSLREGKACLTGCPPEDEGNECFIGVEARTMALEEVWEEEVEGWTVPLARVLPELVKELVELYQLYQSGKIVFSQDEFMIQTRSSYE